MKAQFEKITTTRETSFKATFYEKSQFDAPWHYHPEFELTYIVQSKGLRYVGDNLQKFEERDLVLLGPDLPHCWKNTDSGIGSAKAIVLQWKENILGKGWLQNPEFSAIKGLLDRSHRGIKFGPETTGVIEKLLPDMLDCQPFRKLILLLEILNRLAGSDDYATLSGSGFVPNLKSETSERVNKVYNFVEQNYRNKITLKEVASTVAMSEEAFCRFFKRTLNKTFFSFLNEYRINLACKLLIETDLQVTEIAYECGYESLPYFYRQFHRFVGGAPVHYKKGYRGAKS